VATTLRLVIESTKKGKGGKDAEKELSNLEKTAKKVAKRLAAIGGAKVALDMAKLGAQAERVERRFAAFSKEAGGAAVVLEAFQKGAGGTVSKMDAMSSASRLLQMGLVEDAASMERVVEMATRLGDQTAGATDRVSDFALMLANQSIPRLDNFGISSGKVRARIAELQSQFAGMSRETAFMTAVMEEGGKSLELLGPRVDDDMAAFEKLEAKMADTRVEIGQKLAPAAAEVMALFSDLLGIVSPLIDVVGGLAGKVVELAEGLAVAAGIDLGGIFDIKAATQTAEQMAQLGDSSKITADRLSAWGDKARSAISEGKSLESVLGDLAGRSNDMTDAFAEGGAIADIFVDQTGIMTDVSKQVHEIIKQNTGSYKEYAAAVAEWNAQAADSNVKIQTVTKDTYALRDANALMTAEVRELNEISRQRAEQENVVTQAVLDQARATESSDQAMLQYANTVATGGVMSLEASGNYLTAKAALEEQAAAADRQAQAMANAQAQAAAHKAAMIEDAQATTSLAASLKDATDAQIAQTMIGMLDPEQMGAGAFTDAVTEIQLAFGLADEKSIALSQNIGSLADALNSGIVPAQSADEAIAALSADAADGSVNMEALLAQFGSLPEFAGPAEERMDAFGGALATGSGEAEGFASDLALVEGRLQAIAKTWNVNVNYQTTGTPPGAGGGVPQYPHGGVVPGPVGQPRMVMAHGGERFLGAPTYNTTHNVTINNAAAAALYLHQSRRNRVDRFNSRM
jgi:hypothetical protein